MSLVASDSSLESALYVLATPIGNLEDISARALRVLAKADLVLAEDTRVVQKLFAAYDLPRKTSAPLSCNAHNEETKIPAVLASLAAGQIVALVSDAGTPCLADPGDRLVRAVRAAGFRVIPLPGASAITALLSVSGFNLAHGFHFVGFFPRTEHKLLKLIELSQGKKAAALVGLESPHRILKTLAIIGGGYPDLVICLGRELTKFYEEIVVGTASEILARGFVVKGEFTLVLELKRVSDHIKASAVS